MSVISVLVVDDHDLVRIGVVRLLSEVKGMTVIGEANSGEAALKVAKEKRPDVVLMDLRMPGIGGLEATRKIKRLYKEPDIKVIILTSFDKEPFPSKLLEVGANGYLTKGALVEEMIQAIRHVHAGKHYFERQIADLLAVENVAETQQKSPFQSLSERELQVMLMLTTGDDIKMVAEKLCVSIKTVNSYRYRIYDKLEVDSDVNLTLLAMQYGMLENS